MPYRRYADFSGRSRRLEYWMFHLFFWIVFVGLFIVGAILQTLANGGPGKDNGITIDLFTSIGILFLTGSIIPMISVMVRRFHDQDKSGWYCLLGLIPYIGWLFNLVFMCVRGTDGENQYGPDPFSPEPDSDIFA